jgi:membrane associated rhomboid family serine protease
LVTHGFLHDPADSNFLFNLLLDVLGLYFLGRELLPLLGPGKFLSLFAGALVTGGLAWAAVHWRQAGFQQAGFQYHIGATAAIDALLVVFACFYPDKKIDFLLFFIFPVSVKPKHLALGLAGFDLFGLLFYEIPGASLPFGMVIANSAHLGGMAAGWLYYRYFHDAGWLSFKPKADIELPRWMKRKSKVVVTPAAYQVNLTSRRDLRAEVDRILDKINSDGFGSLSPGEKRLLDEAKDLLSRR